jgi:hypothetical protein
MKDILLVGDPCDGLSSLVMASMKDKLSSVDIEVPNWFTDEDYGIGMATLPFSVPNGLIADRLEHMRSLDDLTTDECKGNFDKVQSKSGHSYPHWFKQ